MNPRIVLTAVFAFLAGCAGTPPESMDPIAEAEHLYKAGRYGQALPIYLDQARSGDKIAQNRLAIMHENGIGVDANPAEAYAWAAIASELGNPIFVDFYAELAESLNTREIERGEEILDEILDRSGVVALAYKRARAIEHNKARCAETGEFLSRCARFSRQVCAQESECFDNFGSVRPNAGLVERSRLEQQRLANFIDRYEKTYGNVILRELRLIDEQKDSDQSEESEKDNPGSSERQNERD